MLNRAGQHVDVVQNAGLLSDHYKSVAKQLALSSKGYRLQSPL